ncbi:thioredoxin family protein [uncultured Bacteroides sp.]|jgi:thioredoxin 1|uniref:thioredoxin family protein n=1 Tax=uncultured Bacteroides sp. TaxID=162156 RepID=UPI00258CBDD5|nr:thioredoxin family protein [uncultured Bacteroides sp.]
MKTKLFFSLLSAFFFLSFHSCSNEEELENTQMNTKFELSDSNIYEGICGEYSVIDWNRYEKGYVADSLTGYDVCSKMATRSVAVTNLSEYKQFVSWNVNAVVYFWAPWCGPCKMMSPYFETLNERHKDIEFLKVNIDDASDIAQYCNVSQIPTFIFYKNGEIIDILVGANKDKLKEMIKRYY